MNLHKLRQTTHVLKKGDRVLYIPSTLFGSKEMESGVVKRIQDKKHAFVIFDQNDIIMKTGEEDYTAQRCRLKDLRKLPEE